jgi:hypothetical protein
MREKSFRVHACNANKYKSSQTSQGYNYFPHSTAFRNQISNCYSFYGVLSMQSALTDFVIMSRV